MKRALTSIALAILLVGCRAEPAHARLTKPTTAYRVEVTSVYDGDTFSINWPGLPPELNPVKIRLRGIDTPERGAKAKCNSEAARADAARAFTVQQIARTRGQIIISDLRWDKYGGRIDADVFVGNNERLVDLLISNGFGREYHGEARTKGWCF